MEDDLMSQKIASYILWTNQKYPLDVVNMASADAPPSAPKLGIIPAVAYTPRLPSCCKTHPGTTPATDPSVCRTTFGTMSPVYVPRAQKTLQR